jgi:protein-tyrosine-phosphatase
MAEALLRRQLAEQGVTAAVSSAGFLPGGWPAMEPAVSVMADLGLDLSGHRSRTVSQEMVEASDLVVGMTRQHVVELALLAPTARERLFQFRDLVRRAETQGRRPTDQALGRWVRTIGGPGGGSRLLGSALEDDIPDPVGQPRAAYERTGRVLNDLSRRLAELIA